MREFCKTKLRKLLSKQNEQNDKMTSKYLNGLRRGDLVTERLTLD